MTLYVHSSLCSNIFTLIKKDYIISSGETRGVKKNYISLKESVNIG